VLINYTQF